MQGNIVILMRHNITIHGLQHHLASVSQTLKCVNVEIMVFYFWNTQINGYTYFKSPHRDHMYNTFAQKTIQTHCKVALTWIEWTTKNNLKVKMK